MKLINTLLFLILTTICSLPAMDAPLNHGMEYWGDIVKEMPLQIDQNEEETKEAQEAKQSLAQRPFVCACGAAFPIRVALAIHQARMHKSTGATSQPQKSWSFESCSPSIFQSSLPKKDPQPVKIPKTSHKEKEESKTALVKTAKKTKQRKVCAIARSLICPKCNMNSFKMISDFKKHILVCCTDLQPYECDEPLCNFACVQSNNLTRHMKTVHERDASTQLSVDVLKKISAAINPFLPAWEFKCEVCNGLFPNVDSLKLHHNKLHHNTILNLPVIITSDLIMQSAKKSRAPKRKTLTLETKDSVPYTQRVQNKSLKLPSTES